MTHTSASRGLPGRLALLLFTAAFTLLNAGVRSALGDVDCRRHHAESPAQHTGGHEATHPSETTPAAPVPCTCLSACHSSTALHAAVVSGAPAIVLVPAPVPHPAVPEPPLVRHPHALPFANGPPPLDP